MKENQYFIYNSKDKIVIRVGSTCVEKIYNELYKAFQNGECKYCKTVIPDRRSNIHKEFYCDEYCKSNERKHLQAEITLKCNELLEYSKTNTKFKTTFVLDIRSQILKGYLLSEKQKQCINKIHNLFLPKIQQKL